MSLKIISVAEKIVWHKIISNYQKNANATNIVVFDPTTSFKIFYVFSFSPQYRHHYSSFIYYFNSQYYSNLRIFKF